MEMLLSHVGYIAGGVLVIIAFWLGRSGGGNTVRARNNSGNMIVGNVQGNISQGVAPHAPVPASEPPKVPPDRIMWGIGIVGVLVALVQLAHDVLK